MEKQNLVDGFTKQGKQMEEITISEYIESIQLLDNMIKQEETLRSLLSQNKIRNPWMRKIIKEKHRKPSDYQGYCQVNYSNIVLFKKVR